MLLKDKNKTDECVLDELFLQTDRPPAADEVATSLKEHRATTSDRTGAFLPMFQR